jgi:hypothetical protein
MTGDPFGREQMPVEVPAPKRFDFWRPFYYMWSQWLTEEMWEEPGAGTIFFFHGVFAMVLASLMQLVYTSFLLWIGVIIAFMLWSTAGRATLKSMFNLYDKESLKYWKDRWENR